MKPVIAIGLLLVLFSGCARSKVNNPSDVQAIKTSVETYAKAVNAHDANAAVSMMTDSAIFAEMNHPVANGKEAIRKLMQSMFEQFTDFDLQFSAPVAEVQVSGDLGAARGIWLLKATHKPGVLAAVQDSGSWSTNCRRQSDGSWKWDWVIINSDQTLPGMTANGADEKALAQVEQDPNGAIERAENALGSLKSAYKIQSVTVKNLNPRVYGDFAVVTMTGELKGIFKGNETSGTLMGVDFFVRRNGKWQAAYSQDTATVP